MASNSEILLSQKQAALAQAKEFVRTLESQVSELTKLIELERKTLAMQDSPFEQFLKGGLTDSEVKASNSALVVPVPAVSISSKPLDITQPIRNVKNAVSGEILKLLATVEGTLTVAEIYETLNNTLENLSTRGSVRGTLHALAANNKIVAHGQGRYSKNGVPIATKSESPALTGLSGVTMSVLDTFK